MLCHRCNRESSPGDVTCRTCGAPLQISEADRRLVTVLFCDLVGSTALSFELDPEELVDIVRQYQAVCSDIIRSEGGYVAQYLGDGILAYFGYPEAHEDDSRRATRAGLQTVDRIATVQARGGPLQVRVGIHTGVVVIGPVGSGPSSQRLAVGEAPNIAARVQAQAGLNQVLVTGETRRLIEGYFEFEDLGPRELAGPSKSTRLFRVCGETGAVSRLDASRVIGLSPFVGRKQEIDCISRYLTAPTSKSPSPMLLWGEGGVGKSRLLDTMSEQALSRGFKCLRSFCLPQHENSPLHPIAALFFRWIGATERGDASPSQVRDALLSAGIHETSDAGLASSLLSIFDERSVPLPGATPQKRRRFIEETVRKWLSQLATSAPVLLVLEDIHWADPSTVDVIASLARSPVESFYPCLSSRPDFDVTRLGSGNLNEIRLGALSREDVAQLVCGLVGRTLPERVTSSVYVETDGIPLFVEEVTRARLEAGLFGTAQDDGARSTNPSTIPARLHEPLMARLDRLGSAKQLAQKASIFGREFTEPMLLSLREPDGVVPELGPIRADLECLVRAGLIAQVDGGLDGTTYSFRHTLIRDAAYGSLLRPAKQAYHYQAALALSLLPTGRRENHVIAMHFEEAGKLGEAAAHWQLSGSTALSRGAIREAIAQLKRAFALLDRLPETPENRRAELELHLAIAPALMSVNGWAAPSVEESCHRALQLARALVLKDAEFQALWGVWSVSFVRGNALRALPVAKQLLAEAQTVGAPVLRVMGHHAMAFTLYCQGKFDDVRRHAEEGLALFSLDQDRLIVQQIQLSSSIVLYGLLAAVLWLQGHAGEAEERLAAGGQLAEQLAHAPSLAVHLSLRAEMNLWQQDAPQLLDTSERMLRLAQLEGFELHETVAHLYRGLARSLLGITDGLSEAEAGAEGYAAMGAAMNLTHGHCVRAELLGRLARPLEAHDLLNKVDRMVDELGEASCRAELLRVRGELFASQGDLPRAIACLTEAADAANKQGAIELSARAKASLRRARTVDEHGTTEAQP